MSSFMQKSPPAHTSHGSYTPHASSPPSRHNNHPTHHDNVIAHALSVNSKHSDPDSPGSSSSSSKAVLAALRTLQDKIRRLETDRARAIEETEALRHRLAGHEVESEQTRARDEAISQRNIQDARSAYDRLLAEKSDLEVRIARAEDRKADMRRAADDIDAQVRALRLEKEAALAAIQDAESQQRHLDLQLSNAHLREREIAQTLAWETQRHESEMDSLNTRLHSLQEQLLAAVRDKSAQDAKMAETDHLVGQLLSVNETLVGKLTGNTKGDGTGKGGSPKKTKPADTMKSAKSAREQSKAIAAAAKELQERGTRSSGSKGKEGKGASTQNTKSHSDTPASASAKSTRNAGNTRSPSEYVLPGSADMSQSRMTDSNSSAFSTAKGGTSSQFSTTNATLNDKFRAARDVRSIQGVNNLYNDLVKQLIHSPSQNQASSSTSGKHGASARKKTSASVTSHGGKEYVGAGLVATSMASRAALSAAMRAGANSSKLSSGTSTSTPQYVSPSNKRGTGSGSGGRYNTGARAEEGGLKDSDFLDLSRELDLYERTENSRVWALERELEDEEVKLSAKGSATAAAVAAGGGEYKHVIHIPSPSNVPSSTAASASASASIVQSQSRFSPAAISGTNMQSVPTTPPAPTSGQHMHVHYADHGDNDDDDDDDDDDVDVMPLSAEIERSRGPYMDQVASLEGQFRALDARYHSILAGTEDNSQSNGTGNSPGAAAEQLVDVIRQLHQTGQQLRDLRSSPPPRPDKHRSADDSAREQQSAHPHFRRA